MLDNRPRCHWPGKDTLMLDYHDNEWGMPLRDAGLLFEYIVLDTFQAGVSWKIVLHKRENFRAALASFDPTRIAAFTERDIERLLGDAGIIRNRAKINGTIKNAQAWLRLLDECGSEEALIDWFWSFTGGKQLVHRWDAPGQTPSTSPESDAMSKALKKKGFTFVGSMTCYAFMQAAGMINDHLTTCYRHSECTL